MILDCLQVLLQKDNSLSVHFTPKFSQLRRKYMQYFYQIELGLQIDLDSQRNESLKKMRLYKYPIFSTSLNATQPNRLTIFQSQFEKLQISYCHLDKKALCG